MVRKRILQTRNVFGQWAVCLLAVGLCFGLGACDQTEKVRQTIDKEATEAKEALASTQKPPNPAVFDPLTITNKLWHGNTALRMHRGVPLPSRYEESRGVTLVSSEPMSLSDVANAISSQTGIPVRLTALTPPGRTGGTAVSSSSSGSSSAAANLEMPLSYEGPLSGLLDSMSAFFGISWRYDGTTLAISRYETRIFSVEALPGSHEINEGMQDDQSSSSGGSSGGGSSSSSSSTSSNTLTQNSKTTIALKYWEELSGVLNTIVGTNGSAIISPTMGTVTVTTTPDIMATVADYIAKENKRLGRQIAINVSIYSVNLGQNEDFGVAFSGFLKHLTGQIHNLRYTTATAPSLNAAVANNVGRLSVAILNGANSASTTNEVFTALSAVGDTTTVAQFPMTTLNNRPVSRRVGTDTSYISSVNAVTATGTTTATTFTPVVSTIRDGFSLQLTPRLLDDGRILLQYSLGLIGIQSMGATTFDEGGGVTVPLSLPVTDNRIFVQQSMLRSGQTLVIGGVDQRKTQQNKQGVGTPDNFVLGGGTSSHEDHLMMFISITPQVMDVAAGEQS